MKRALAARAAKHDPNGLTPSMLSPSSSSQPELHQPPRKISKVENDNNNKGGITNISGRNISSGNNNNINNTSLSCDVTLSRNVTYSSHPKSVMSRNENGSEPVKRESSFPANRNTPGGINESQQQPDQQHQYQHHSQHQNQRDTTKKTTKGGISSSPRSSSVTMGSSSKGAGKTPMKRPRGSQNTSANTSMNAGVVEEDDEDRENSCFFLKHQNAALASELKQLRYQFKLLEKERYFRRNQCKDANQALHTLEATWRAMEVALQLGQQPPQDEESTGNNSVSDDLPRSSGTGESVELIGVLLDSLATIMKDGKLEQHGSKNDKHIEQLYDIKRMSTLVSKRATALQRWIWDLIKKVTTKDESGKHPLLKLAKIEFKISTLKAQSRNYQKQIVELSKSRDDAISSETRVRRGLYRLSVGRMKLDEVMKSIEIEDEDKSAASMIKFEEAPPPLQSAGDSTIKNDPEEGVKSETVDTDQLERLQKQIRDLEEISSAKEKHIAQLSKEREEHMKRINELMLHANKQKVLSKKIVSEDDIKRSELFTNTWTRMTTAERQLEEVKQKLIETKENWATARGNAEHATKNLEEQLSKHRKRWAELTNANNAPQAIMTENNAKDSGVSVKDETLMQAQIIAELEHKLKQALESVRRADVVRASLEEASQTNETLHSLLEEMKAKNAALLGNKQQGKSESSSSSSREISSSSSSSKQVELPAGEKAEKLYRRMRKDTALAIASKEKAKALLEKSEKDRESLLKTNSRLIEQSKEKDEMNANSLSTILHLKSLTEKLNQEKELLKQQVKSAGQVNVAARLAVNAKERVIDETLKQRKLFDQKISGLEGKCELLKIENDKASGSLAKKKAEMTDLERDASTVKERCDELVSESTKHQEEKRKILESLEIAKREAGDSAKKIAMLMLKGGGGGRGGGGHSDFTKDQLTTQITVLKGRLTCPVCNHNDKNCILARCRHMFCKQCVEKMIKDRNRKCPSCGQRFDNKDVEDIWL
mmetsp:Transcript_29639/g.33841  ORF Transcript_29639/g.33841 Transcript_29639/m.33841 type:complete len:1000 (+) Transcript_29639:453-3452(+)